MPFPVSLSPSPVSEAFAGIQWDPIGKLELLDSERALLRAAEDNVLGYILADPNDAATYAHLLLKVLDQLVATSSGSGSSKSSKKSSSSSSSQVRKVSKLSLDDMLPDDEALQLLYTDLVGVVSHYAITKLCDVVMHLRSENDRLSTGAAAVTSPTSTSPLSLHTNGTPNKKHSYVLKATMASTFFPDGILVENWRPLLRILLRGGSDAFSQRGAAFCLAGILSAGTRLERECRLLSSVSTALESFVSWMTSRLQSSSSSNKSLLRVVTPSLTELMTSQDARYVFDRNGGIGYLSRHLRVNNSGNHREATVLISNTRRRRGGGGGGSNGYNNGGNNNSYSSSWASNSGTASSSSSASVQRLYELVYCLWLMSYDCDVSESIRNDFHRDGAVPALVDLVAAAPREKVLRCSLSTLRNLAQCGQVQDGGAGAGAGTFSTTLAMMNGGGGGGGSKKCINGAFFLKEMIGCGLVKTIDLMRDRKWNDQDVMDDLDALHVMLHDAHREMTRWDVYATEVESKHLQWGVLHTEQFFQQNARLMEGKDGNFNIVKDLIRLISSDDDDVAAVACYDLGEFVRHYPNGRSVAKRLGARDVVLNLIEHDNDELQRQALTCLSKMLIQNWEAIR